MLKIIPVFFVGFLLSGCGYHGCMSQSDVTEETIKSTVYTQPKKDPSGKDEIWVKLDAGIHGKKFGMKVDHRNLDFCKDAETTTVLQISDDRALVKGGEKEFSVRLPVPIMPGEKVRFSLVPVLSVEITNDICMNKNESIYVPNPEECKKEQMGVMHSVESSSTLAKKHGFANVWYRAQKGSGVSAGFHASIIRGYKVDKERYKDEERRKSDDKYLCYTEQDIEKEADEAVKKENENKKTSTDNNKKQKKKNEIEEKVRQARIWYKEFLDEFAVNLRCGYVCGTDKGGSPSERSGGTTSSSSDSCAFYPVSYSDGTGSSATSVRRLPFVVLKESKLELEKQLSFTDDSEDKKPRLTTAGTLPQTGAREPSSFDFTAAYSVTPRNKENIKAFLPKVDEYLALDASYVLSKTNGATGKVDEIKISVRNDTNDKKNGGGIAGSYKLSVRKDCSSHIENSLYYTFSKDYPKVLPGDDSNAHKKIDFMGDKQEVVIDLSNSGSAQSDEYLYYGVKDNGDGYQNNTGYFTIDVKFPRKPKKVIAYVIEKSDEAIRRALHGNSGSIVSGMYRHITQQGPFIRMVNAMLILYILLSSLYFFLGFSKASIFQLVCIFAKIIIVMFLLRPNSWSFFNDHLFNLFINGPKMLIEAMTGDIKGSGGDFGFMDAVLYRFSISHTWLQLLAMLFAGPLGWLTVVLIFWGLFVLLECMFTSVIIYLISTMLIALLLCIAPFFLACILFRRTKAIFDAWIKVLLQTAMQPVLIFSCLAVLVQVINSVIYAMLNFEVCDSCILTVHLSSAQFCLFQFLLPVGVMPLSAINETVRELYNTGDVTLLGVPGPFMNVLIFIALANAARDFVVNSGDMSSIMFGAFTNLSDVGWAAGQAMLSVAGLDKTTSQTIAYQKHQSELSDRGPGVGRTKSFVSRLMPGIGGDGQDAGGKARKPIIHLDNPPPSSF